MPTMIRPIQIVDIGIIGTRRSKTGSDDLPNPGITFFLSMMERSDGELRHMRKRYVYPISPLHVNEGWLIPITHDIEPDLFEGEIPDDLPITDDMATIYLSRDGRITIIHYLMLTAEHMTQVEELLRSIAKKANQAQPGLNQTSSPT